MNHSIRLKCIHFTRHRIHHNTVGTQKKCLAEMLLMSTHNICSCGEIRKISTVFGGKKLVIYDIINLSTC